MEAECWTERQEMSALRILRMKKITLSKKKCRCVMLFIVPLWDDETTLSQLRDEIGNCVACSIATPK